MKTYTAKTIEDALKNASDELAIPTENLIYEVAEEKKGLFKKITVNVFELEDVRDYACEYLESSIEQLGIEATATATQNGELIKITINSDHNPILIGKNGRTLQALNELTKVATSAKFKRRFRILLDVNDYKEDKYSKIARVARNMAKEVQRTKIDAQLEPMPADERRVIHNALAEFSHIKTESSGDGTHRAVNIKYVE